MKIYRALAAAALVLPLATLPAMAQRTAGDPNPGEVFKDTSMLKPAPGVKIAIIEWQDLMCPACAHAFPIVHGAIAHYNIPLYEKDFTLPGHAAFGNMEAALWARYLQDKVSPQVADQYRGFIFNSQSGISSKADMESFTRRFFSTHGLKLPFVADPTGELSKEVLADKAQGEKLGIEYTPCIVVVTQHEWVHVTDVSMLYQTIDQELAKVGGAGTKPAVKKTAQATH
jgi:protein-disulfide isomerase